MERRLGEEGPAAARQRALTRNQPCRAAIMTLQPPGLGEHHQMPLAQGRVLGVLLWPLSRPRRGRVLLKVRPSALFHERLPGSVSSAPFSSWGRRASVTGNPPLCSHPGTRYPSPPAVWPCQLSGLRRDRDHWDVCGGWFLWGTFARHDPCKLGTVQLPQLRPSPAWTGSKTGGRWPDRWPQQQEDVACLQEDLAMPGALDVLLATSYRSLAGPRCPWVPHQQSPPTGNCRYSGEKSRICPKLEGRTFPPGHHP